MAYRYRRRYSGYPRRRSYGRRSYGRRPYGGYRSRMRAYRPYRRRFTTRRVRFGGRRF